MELFACVAGGSAGRLDSQVAPGFGPDAASIWLRSSDDDGATWSASRELTRDLKDESWGPPVPGLRMPAVMASVFRYSAVRDGDAYDLLLHSGIEADEPFGLRRGMRVWASTHEGVGESGGSVGLDIRFGPFNPAYLGIPRPDA